MTTTVIFPWETTHLHPACEWTNWHQLRALGVDNYIMVADPNPMPSLAYDCYPTMAEALTHAVGTLVLLDSTGSKTVAQIPKDGDVTIVVGSTSITLTSYGTADDRYAINQAGVGDMFGVNAAAIALDHRHGSY